MNAGATETIIDAKENTGVDLYTDNSKILSTDSHGISIVNGGISGTEFVTMRYDSASASSTHNKFIVTVASKDATHRYPGGGASSTNGYKINGIFAPVLLFSPGNTYYFDLSDGTNSSHPFNFYLQADKQTAYTTGVTSGPSAGSAGAYVSITVDDATPQVLHYQCGSHGYMGNQIFVLGKGGVSIDSAYVETVSLDSERTIALIDSAYVQARGFPGDSTHVTALINATIDSIGAIANVSSVGATNNQILKFDSSTQTFVLASDATGGGGGGGLDSALVSQLIDSDYIALRIGGPFVDSAYVESFSLDSERTIALVDSDYVQARQAAGAGITIQDEGGALSTLATTLNFVGSGVVASGTGASKTITISGGGGGSGTLDSALTLQLIDSGYVAERSHPGGSLDVFRWSKTATAGQLTFSGNDSAGVALSLKNTTAAKVFINGILQLPTQDYTLTTTQLTLNDSATLGHIIAIQEDQGRLFREGGFTENKFVYKPATPTSAFTGADASGSTLNYAEGSVEVYLNGILLSDSDDYTKNAAGSSITLISACDSNDTITILNRKGTVTTPTITTFEYIANASQSAFTGADANSNTLSFVNANHMQVFVNGILIKPGDDYTVDVSGQQVNLVSAANASDDVVICTFAAPGTQMKAYKFNADSGQTSFAGDDIAGTSLSYIPGNVNVFLNGLLLNDSDFTATNGAAITLETAADAGDDLRIVSHEIARDVLRTVSGFSEVTADVNAVSGDRLIVNTTDSARTITLPTGAVLGDLINVIDGTGNASTNNITISRNSHKILGADSDLIIDINRGSVELVYYNTSQGWILTEN